MTHNKIPSVCVEERDGRVCLCITSVDCKIIMEVTTTNNSQVMLDKERINTLPIMESRLIIVLQKSNVIVIQGEKKEEWNEIYIPSLTGHRCKCAKK